MEITCECGSKDFMYDEQQEYFICVKCGLVINALGWMSVLPRIERILSEEKSIIQTVEEKRRTSYVAVRHIGDEIMEPTDVLLPKLQTMYAELSELDHTLKQIEKKTQECKEIAQELEQKRTQRKNTKKVA